ncbi:MAG TPA: T9SS type A sorting domain-containing protein, partial [Sunxiuqinia sp.]|nr:T9SS type A sorting domain-containing protein [Sunxiuqinia sp.]
VVEATDNIGIQSVVMDYSVDGGTAQELVLQKDTADYYKAMLKLNNLVDGDSVQYRIIATDISSNHNQAILPNAGYYTFYIDGFYGPVTNYYNNFNSSRRDFISKDFTVNTPTFFSNGALNSPHPYPSPDKDNTEFNFTAILKHPVILDDHANMSFNEVVLVEPGESGSVYGDDNFWDYVIVEGSKNGKVNWLPLIDGYDSRADSSWLSAFNSDLAGGNSLADGEESEFVNRQLKMTTNGNFAAGDTIFIRFRLFSDPYAHGWGWIIDDLKIQDVQTNVSLNTYSSGELQVYPNPVQDNLIVKGNFKSMVGQLKISIYNTFGQVVQGQDVAVNSKQLVHQLEVGNLPNGLYLVAFQFENGQVITRKFVKR